MNNQYEKALNIYYEKVREKSLLIFGKNKEVLTAIVDLQQTSRFDSFEDWDKKHSQLLQLLWTDKTKKLSDIFFGSEYKVLVTLLGKEWAWKFKQIWDRSSSYIYSSGWERRSFRARSNESLYLTEALTKLRTMIKLVALGFTYENYFSNQERYGGDHIIPDLLAAEIDNGNEEIVDRIKDIIYGDAVDGVLRREMIKGALMSHSEEAHKWIADLLLAAKLQEGLRQTIVECMDEGSLEGFQYMLQVIIDHDLIRFSSVVRALDVWTGLGIQAEKPTVVKKCLETGYRCLQDKNFLDKCLKSENALQIYMGLWAVAVEDVLRVLEPIQQLLFAKEKYKRLVALYFLNQIQIPVFQHRYAAELLDDQDLEVQSWVLKNLFSDTRLYQIRPDSRFSLKVFAEIEGIPTVEELFTKLHHLLERMRKKEMIYKESVFPWLNSNISRDEIVSKMLYTVALKPTDEKIDFMLDYEKKMAPYSRVAMIEGFLSPPKTTKQKQAILKFLGDRASDVRSAALQVVEKLKLTQEDYMMIEDLLQYKTGELRKNVISILVKQKPDAVLASIDRLLAASDENKQLAALDMIAYAEKDKQLKSITEKGIQLIGNVADTSQQAKILAEKIVKAEDNQFNLETGLGLFQADQSPQFPEPTVSNGFSNKTIFSSTLEEMKVIIQAFSHVVEQYKDYEYETQEWDGEARKVVLGAEYSIRRITKAEKGVRPKLDDYPLTEIWREKAAEYQLSTQKLLEILFYYETSREHYTERASWYSKLTKQMCPVDANEFEEFVSKLPYSNHVFIILQVLLNEYPEDEAYQFSRDMIGWIYNQVPKQRFAEEYIANSNRSFYGNNRHMLGNAPEISYWYRHVRKKLADPIIFKEIFSIGYVLYQASNYQARPIIELQEFERAYELGLIDENELYTELCARPYSSENLRALTNKEDYLHKSVADCQKLKEVCEKVVTRIVEIELKRGDLTTEVSHLASSIYHCQGTRFFVDILVGMGKDTYVRGYNFVGTDSTKKQIFSHLLKHCYPATDENETTLKALLEKHKVTDKQLVEAAMYAPQWLEIVENYLEWPGLKSACWFFHAHINEHFSKDKEAIVSLFSPISPQDFKDGAIDIDWFHEVYSQLGKKQFQIVYNSAKYIAGGGLHKRSQLFTDALLDKLELDQVEEKIRDKRNKDYVLCYGLIPIQNGKQEMIHRYEFLHQFLKESKKFGAQRRASEAKVVTISLENLARNAGFADTNRFTWYIETEKIDTIRSFLEPAIISDVEVFIDIDDLGRSIIKTVKDGKELKSVPARLKNDEYIKEIKAVHKSLKDQYARARQMLERAMIAGSLFTVDELTNLSNHPVIYPLLKNLVFKSGNSLGYYRNRALESFNGEVMLLDSEDSCFIAHPVHLYQGKVWADYQRDLFEKGIIQPFKQVFRELYQPNEDELAVRTVSRRYDGHQIQPKKAAALLRSRDWTINYGDGPRKIFYKENIVAQVFAMADWFSPADVESPTIEGVYFFGRNSWKPLDLGEIPNVIFSEVMRDLDLVVSVAHAGGVDPEASLSTVEMRAAIIAETLRLLKLENVKLKGSHAHIDGQLGEYTVHLGSGIVHKMAKGALHIIPVHSQHRGRLFLPFIDDDPKTAEILAKTVLLAEDNKLKDPTLLAQISD